MYTITYSVTELDGDVTAGSVPTASVVLVDSLSNSNTAFTDVTEAG